MSETTQSFETIDWPTYSAEEINLVEAFILADRVHSWFAANDAVLNMNYLTLICLGYCGKDDEDKWAASFDCLGDMDSEWGEHVEDYLFAARGGCPEEAIYKAAMRVKERIENDERTNRTDAGRARA
jgi:hypothetical protein